MRNLQLQRQLQRIQSLIIRTDDACKGQFDLQAHWGRYICVMISGFLENAIGLVYSDFVYKTSQRPTATYASSTLLRIQNPNSDRFIKTASAFRSDWGDALREYLNEGGRKEAIDGIMNNRNGIVHGKDTGITLATVKDYLRRALEVIEFIEHQCNDSS